MFAHELISDSIPALRTSDTVQKVHERMAEFRVNHLPIVNDKQFLKTKVSCVEFPEYICKDENFEEKMKIDSVKHFTALNVIVFVEFERSKF